MKNFKRYTANTLIAGVGLAALDVEGQKIVHGVGVLAPVEPMRRNRRKRVPTGFRLVERVLEPRDESHSRLLVRMRLLGRRHQMTAELANGLLERVGVLREVLRVDLLEVEVARVVTRIMTIGAIPTDHLPLLFAGGRNRLAAELGAAGSQHEHGGWAENLEGGVVHCG